VPYSGEMSDQRTVRVATCSGSAEVTVIRSVLEAHGIHPIIPGEVVGSLAPHLTAFSIPIFVDAEDAEEAEKLIAEVRSSEPLDDEQDEDDDEDDAAESKDVALVVDRRVRLGVTVLLSLVITFGTGHMSTGAWKRGLALAAVEIVGARHAAAGSRWGVALVAAAVLFDLVGSVIRVRARSGRAALPRATLKRG
jgi:hypothetical protein